MIERFRDPQFLRRFLAVALCVGMVGVFKPVLFNEGGSMAKYIAKQSQVEMVDEQAGAGGLDRAFVEGGEVAPEVERIFLVNRVVVLLLGLGVILLLVPKWLERSPAYHILLLLSLWLILESVGKSLYGGKPHTELALFAHGARWGMPLVLWWMIHRFRRAPEAAEASPALIHLAVIVTAFTFATHGWEALHLYAPFQGLIHGFFGLLGMQVSTECVTSILRVIGVMDWLLAITILFCRHPKIFLWMACWGFITASSRPLTLGIDAWPELAMRTAYFALPLFLYLIHSKPKKLSP